MPKLPTFTADTTVSDPGNGGRRATTEDLANGLVGAGHAIQQAADHVLTHIEENESRKALVASSEIRAKYSKALDEAALSGDDLAPIKQKMQDEFSKVSENFTTKKGLESNQVYAANTSLMFDEQANHIAVQRASSDAKLEAGKFLSSASAVIQSNPLYLSTAEGDAETLAGTFTKIPAPMRAQIADGLKKELNMAAALSAARIDPEGTRKRLDGGEWNLTPEQRNAAVNKSETEIRARRAEDAYMHAEMERVKRDLDDKARDTHFADIMGGTATRRSIMDDADLRPQTREHLILFMEQRAKEVNSQEKKSDPVVVRDLWLRIHTDDSDPRKIFNGDAIFEAVKDGKVNTTDANNLNALVANQKDENNKSIGQRLGNLTSVVGRALSQDPQFTAQPALVAEIQNDYQARVYDKVNQLRGEKKNPNDIFNPASSEYVGSREFIQASIDAARERQRRAMPQAPVVNTQAEYDALAPGTPYVDSKGVRGVKTGATKPVDSAKADYLAWVQATGGLLKPGQNVEQAVAAWKASK